MTGNRAPLASRRLLVAVPLDPAQALAAVARPHAAHRSGNWEMRPSGASRPIFDYYDPEDGDWWHVPYPAAMGRLCRVPGSSPKCSKQMVATRQLLAMAGTTAALATHD